jgi:predicted Zn finger-like uncharacterized protein
MILTCPACGTRYALKEGAIPQGGRQVRCASCKHSWHQDPEPAASLDPSGEQALPEQGSGEEFPAPGALSHPAGEPGGKPPEAALSDHAHPDIPAEVEDAVDPDASPLPEPGAASAIPSPQPPPTDWTDEPSSEPARAPEPEPILADGREPPSEDSHAPLPADLAEDAPRSEPDEFPAYVSAGGEPQPRRRRGFLGLLLALLLIALAVAAFWFLAPAEWKQRLGVAEPSGSPVMVQLDQTNRRTLASGNELLEVTGKVINPTDQPQRVPQIEAMLRTYQQKIVYRWTIPPPAPVLAPGGSATFNSAELLSIPADAACLSVLASDAARTKLEPCTPASQQVAAQPS